MARSRTFPPALAPAVLGAAIVLPLAVGALVPSAFAADGATPRMRVAQEQGPAQLALEQGLRRSRAAEQAQAAALAAEQAAAAQVAAQVAAQAAADRAAAETRASRSGRTASGSPRDIAKAMLADRGQADQFSCLDRLWVKESEWRVSATNPSSGAYGIPQSLPARKMASAGADWRTNPATQIRWGIDYISERYGSPCAAWRHSQQRNWY